MEAKSIALSAFLSAAALLAIERVAYALIWRRPEAFRALCERMRLPDPVEVLERLFYGFKLLQAAVFVAWCWHFGAEAGWARNWTSPAGGFGLVLIAVGQTLNASVFLRLGRTGVFYGNRFGHQVAWREGFPFSLLDHPQYAGAVLSIWGLFLLARHPYDDWFVLPLLETFYYALGACFERAPDRDAAPGRG